MRKRILTTLVGLPLLILIVNIGDWPLIVTLMLLSLIGLNEMYVAFSNENKAIHLIGYIFTVVYYASTAIIGVSSWLLIELTLFVIVAQAFLVLFYKHTPLYDNIVTIYGFFCISFLLSFIYLVREHELGRYYVWLIFTSSFGCDTFAYLIGTRFGKHKLTGSPSPKKTVEGIVGGVLGAALVGWLYGLFISGVLGVKDISIITNATIVSLCGAMFSIIGDMSASAFKRYTKIKDFGKVFPGHGGVLDRFDSVIMTAPIVYLVMTAVIRLNG
ncbi:MAG: phosphatidate cytidylyltransferase [Clostridiales bacterium]|nr:phosphatidate cytidylyltransferase [Clostridiales bacterium]